MNWRISACVAVVAFGATLAWSLRTSLPQADSSGLVPPSDHPQPNVEIGGQSDVAELAPLGKIKETANRLQHVAQPEAPKAESAHGDQARHSGPLLTWHVLDRVYSAPLLIVVGDLMRHEEINPHLILPTGAEERRFRQLCDSFLPSIDEMLKALAVLANEEVAVMAQRGLLRPLEYSDSPRAVKHMQRVRDENLAHGLVSEPLFTAAFYYKDAAGLKWFTRHEGRNYGACDGDLAQFSQGRVMLAQSAHDFYLRLVALSNYMGWLDEEEFARRVSSGADWLEVAQLTAIQRRGR